MAEIIENVPEKKDSGRSMWSGSVSIGLINVPMKLMPMYKTEQGFKMLRKGDNTPIKSQDICDGVPIADSDIVKGYKQDDGTFVIFAPEEVDGLKSKSDKLFKIDGFVDSKSIDPCLYDKSYVMVPDKQSHAYFLLQSALELSGKAAVGKIVLRTKDAPAIVRSYDGGIVLTTMRYPEDMIKPSSMKVLQKRDKIGEEELGLAISLLNGLTKDIDITKYKNEYRERLKQVIDLKKQGVAIESIVPQEAAATEADALLEALKKSIEMAKVEQPMIMITR